MDSDLTVLLVEDDHVANFISKKILNHMGINQITVAINGLEACDMIQEQCPKLIFLDLNMPVMDGFEFLNVKQTKGICPKSFVVVLTSSTRFTDQEKVKKFDNIIDFIEKPLDGTKVKQVLSKLEN